MIAPRCDIHLFDLGFCLVMMFILVSLAAEYPTLAGKNARAVRYRCRAHAWPEWLSASWPASHARMRQMMHCKWVQQNRFECTLRNTIFPMQIKSESPQMQDPVRQSMLARMGIQSWQLRRPALLGADPAPELEQHTGQMARPAAPRCPAANSGCWRPGCLQPRYWRISASCSA